jgi:Transposase
MPSRTLSPAQKRHLDAFLRFLPQGSQTAPICSPVSEPCCAAALAECEEAEYLDSIGRSFWIPLHGPFARTLRRDLEAVKLSMTTPWSNGPIEGHISRLKAIKRQMYGRAGFELLKARVLPWDASSAA